MLAHRRRNKMVDDLNLEPQFRDRVRAVTNDFFDDLLITDKRGAVLFQDVHSGLRLSRLDDVVTKALPNSTSERTREASSTQTDTNDKNSESGIQPKIARVIRKKT